MAQRVSRRAQTPPPDARLQCAANFVRPGAWFADVGCDHAYLSCYLCQRDAYAVGIASDLRQGPLCAARRTLQQAGLTDRVQTVLCDGLATLDKYDLTDICILGMGGETIAGILQRAPFTQNETIRLILQPMTQAARLRAFLLEHGYTIRDEALCRAATRIYAVICAEYTGVPAQYTQIELLLGKCNIDRFDGNDPLFTAYCRRHLRALIKQRNGREKAGLSNTATNDLYQALMHLGGTEHA